MDKKRKTIKSDQWILTDGDRNHINDSVHDMKVMVEKVKVEKLDEECAYKGDTNVDHVKQDSKPSA